VERTERQLVEHLRRTAQRHAPAARGAFLLKQGIGDDCAVISGARGLEHDLLVTTDLFLEGIHFRKEWQPAASVGYKVLVRGLSDIAAMGGDPRFAFLSLGLPRNIPSRWVDDFFRGLFHLAEQSGVTLAGGDTGASRSGVVADIMVIGEVPRGKAVLRSGARPGDEIWVSGKLGGAARALALLRKGKTIATKRKVLEPLFYPQARIGIGRLLRERGLASAMMDLSDGLSIDLARLCKASGAGARLEESAIPRNRQTPISMALHGGEDFELLFTVHPANSGRVPNTIGGVPLTRIGTIVASRKLRLLREGREFPLPVLGFEHF
jgi:thiamine-monophosphate kinase